VQEKPKSTDFHLALNSSIISIYPVLIDLKNYTYFYFDIPSDLISGNYSFVLEDLLYIKDGILVQEDQSFNLNIIRENTTGLYINPGIVITDITKENSFEISVRNPSLNNTYVNVSASDDFISPDRSHFLLNLGSSRDVRFSTYVMFVDKTESSIMISYGNSSYIIPVIIRGLDSSKSINSSINENGGELSFLEDEFNLTIDSDQSVSGFVKIFNNLGGEIFNVKSVLSQSLKDLIDLEFEEIESIKQGETIKNHIYINEDKNTTPGNYSGKIDLVYNGEVYDSILIKVVVLEKETDNNTLNGFNNTTNDNLPERREDSRKNVVIVLLSIVLVLLIAIYVKYRTSSKKKTNSFLGN
jgi:hypothetical protein